MSPPAPVRTEAVRITRSFNALVGTVWKAWTEPDLFRRWWAPKDVTCPSARLDVRVGGTYLAAMRDTNGKEVWSTGTYREVVPGERLVYTDFFADPDGRIITPQQAGFTGDWSGTLVVTVVFRAEHGATVMDLTHEGFPPGMVADCTQGWNECLDKLQAVVEGR
ncbi:MAG: SRPBCC domain-containing protein [Bacteroidetes bacterium]|nr:SRPBCC domain-containing protein [Bacteroidota bacterium]